MKQGKIEVFVGLALIVSVASYGWYYHFSKDDSATVATLSDAVIDEVSSLAGLKVNQADFSQAPLTDPYTHLAVNGEVWFTQTADGFDSPKTLLELQAIPEDAWYSPASLSKMLNFSPTWDKIKTYIESFFSESE